MKVELISLMLAASLAVVAALPVETSGGGVTAEGAREERARKETAKLRLEHRSGDDDSQSAGEVVEASEVVVSNAGDKSVAQAQPVGVASAGQGGVAVSSPQGVAVVGPGGLAISRPIAVAVAGPGADNPLIFLKPEAELEPPMEGEGGDGSFPDVEEPDEEKPPQAMFYAPYTPYAPTHLLYYPPLYNHFMIL